MWQQCWLILCLILGYVRMGSKERTNQILAVSHEHLRGWGFFPPLNSGKDFSGKPWSILMGCSLNCNLSTDSADDTQQLSLESDWQCSSTWSLEQFCLAEAQDNTWTWCFSTSICPLQYYHMPQYGLFLAHKILTSWIMCIIYFTLSWIFLFQNTNFFTDQIVNSTY